MITQMSEFPSQVYTCKKNMKVELRGDVWTTKCSGAWECYGCDGIYTFKSPLHPLGFKEIKMITSMVGLSRERKKEGALWMNGEEIDKILEPYKEMEGQYYWKRRLYCDLDTIAILIWEE